MSEADSACDFLGCLEHAQVSIIPASHLTVANLDLIGNSHEGYYLRESRSLWPEMRAPEWPILYLWQLYSEVKLNDFHGC